MYAELGKMLLKIFLFCLFHGTLSAVPHFDLEDPEDGYHGLVRENQLTVQVRPKIRAIGAEICGFQIINTHNYTEIPFDIILKDKVRGEAEFQAKRSPDCEEHNVYKFGIAAISCNNETSEKASVRMTVLDVNEYSPIFSKPSYVQQVDEGKLHYNILTVEATDGDCSARLGDICEYQILTPDQPFSIDSDGVIRNTERLDYNRTQTHILSVVAYDCNMNRSPPVTVTIKVNRVCTPGWKGIIGNNDAPSETWYPSVVQIGDCGATILNKVWLLTAAHCQVSNDTIAIAGNPFKCPVPKHEQKRRIAKMFKHEEYDDKTFFNDIALFQLDEPLEFTDGVQPVKLIHKDYTVGDATWSTVLGWGSSEESGPDDPPRLLQQKQIQIRSNKTCAEAYRNQDDVFYPGIFCAGYVQEGGNEECSGDPGGPLYVAESRQRPSETPWQQHFQVGIVAFGHNCARPDKPAAYTKVQFYLDWIEKTMRENRHESELSSSAEMTFDSDGVRNAFLVFVSIFLADFV